MSIADHKYKEALLPRLLQLKDISPLVILFDSIAQSADHLITEVLHRLPQNRTLVVACFENTSFRDSQRCIYVDCRSLLSNSLDSIVEKLQATLADQSTLYIDSLSRIPPEELNSFLMKLVRPNATLFATFHLCPVPRYRTHFEKHTKYPNLPSTRSLLTFLATTYLVLDRLPEDENEDMEENQRKYEKIQIARGSHSSKFLVEMVHRRRSGRGVEARYSLDSELHKINYLAEKKPSEKEEQSDVLKGLSTFNLATTASQQAARDQVELPFFKAQEFGDGGAKGGAIIYEFEKDDDYDEEDPYEDPF